MTVIRKPCYGSGEEKLFLRSSRRGISGSLFVRSFLMGENKTSDVTLGLKLASHSIYRTSNRETIREGFVKLVTRKRLGERDVSCEG